MRIRLDYGTDGLEVDLPDERVTLIEPMARPAVPDAAATLTAAMRTPIGCAPLRQRVRKGQRVAISVCDITRAQPRREQLQALFEEMPDIRRSDVTIVIATGTHRANTAAELEQMLGADIVATCRVVNHDSRDPATLAYVGRTSTGVPVYLNREWLEADIRITTGFVEPHFFAGFSGGPKMVAPGLAGLETVMMLHDARRIGHPNATWGVTEGNPVHDDVREIATHGRRALRRGRDAQSRSADHGRLCRRHPRGASRRLRCYARETAMRAVDAAVRCRADDEFGVSARSESLSGGEGHVRGGEDRQAGRNDRLCGGMPRRPSVARFVRRILASQSIARSAARP